jgi:hypothetical protein
MLNSDLDAIVPMLCVTLAALVSMLAEAFREKGERMPMAVWGLIGLAGAQVLHHAIDVWKVKVINLSLGVPEHKLQQLPRRQLLLRAIEEAYYKDVEGVVEFNPVPYFVRDSVLDQGLLINGSGRMSGIDFLFQKEIGIYKGWISYSWSSGPGGGKITLDSVVVWKLEPRDSGTELFLEHSGFAKEENLNFFNGLNHGWVEKLQNIANLLTTATHDATKA